MTDDRESELPSPLERDVSALAKALQGEQLDRQEAVERLAELEERLDALAEELSPQGPQADTPDAHQTLDRAGRELAESGAESLQQALQSGDLDAAAEAVERLSEDLAQAGEADQQRAAEALDRASQRLRQSGDPNLQEIADGMQQTSDALSRGDAGGTRQAGRDLAESMRNADVPSGPQLEPSAQEQLRGAVKSARQRLEQEGPGQRGQPAPGRPGAQPSPGQGGSQPGPRAGQGPEAPFRQAGPRVGQQHTWEEVPPEGVGGQPDRSNRLSAREEGEHLDDFQRLYDAVRLEGAQATLTPEQGQLDPDGELQTMRFRVSRTDETSQLNTVELPARYRQAATSAVEDETIPPAYRRAVQHYFDEMGD